MLYIMHVMNTRLLRSQRRVSLYKKQYCCFCFPAYGFFTENWAAVHLISEVDQVHLPLFPSPFPSPPPL